MHSFGTQECARRRNRLHAEDENARNAPARVQPCRGLRRARQARGETERAPRAPGPFERRPREASEAARGRECEVRRGARLPGSGLSAAEGASRRRGAKRARRGRDLRGRHRARHRGRPGRRSGRRAGDDRRGVRLRVPVLPQGARHAAVSVEDVQRQAARRVQEHGRSPADRHVGAPRELRRGQAGQVRRVRERSLDEGLRSLCSWERPDEAVRGQRDRDREGRRARRRQAQEGHALRRLPAADQGRHGRAREVPRQRNADVVRQRYAGRRRDSGRRVQDPDRPEAQGRRRLGRQAGRLLPKRDHDEGREEVSLQKGSEAHLMLGSTPMKTLSCILFASSLLLGCQSDSKLDSKSGGDLEARVKKLEEANAKYAEALDFLQQVYGQQKQQQQAQEREEPAPDAVFAVDITPDVAAGQVEGPADAPVTIVEAFDFACPYCRKVSDTLESLMKTYNGKLRIVYKNMVVHPQVATSAHLASCAAAKQGKYVAFKNVLWTKGFDAYSAARDPSKRSEDNIVALAKDAGLDSAKLKTDMHSDDCQNRLKADMEELEKF